MQHGASAPQPCSTPLNHSRLGVVHDLRLAVVYSHARSASLAGSIACRTRPGFRNQMAVSATAASNPLADLYPRVAAAGQGSSASIAAIARHTHSLELQPR